MVCPLGKWQPLERKDSKASARATQNFTIMSSTSALMLLNASKENTELVDTALGRGKRRKMSECKQALRDMSEENFQELIAAWANRASEIECKCNGQMDAM